MNKIKILIILFIPLITTGQIKDCCLESLNDYKSECYADSSKKWAHIELDLVSAIHCVYNNDEHGEVCVDAEHYFLVWIHKEPTLDGFEKFLNKIEK